MIGWLIVGLLAGLIARALVPGPQRMGCLMTLALGLTGSLVGGYIWAAIFQFDPMDTRPHAGGLLTSILGAVLVLALVNGYNRRRFD